MTQLSPFFLFQASLDQKAAIAVSMAIGSLGPAYQILKVGSDEKGWFIDLASQQAPSTDWIDELIRRAENKLHALWPQACAMTGSNLREYWRHRGQHLRAQGFLPALLYIITIDGYIEPVALFYGDSYFPSESFDLSTVKLSSEGCLEQSDLIKGHHDKCWRLQGRAFMEAAGLKLWNRHKNASMRLDKKNVSLKSHVDSKLYYLQGPALVQVIKHERVWQDFLLENFAKTTFKASHKHAKTNGWWLGVCYEIPRVREELLFQQKENMGLELSWRAQEEELLEKFSCVLRQIYQVAKMLSLEVKSTLLLSDQSQLCFWQALLDDEEAMNSWIVDVQLHHEEQFVLWGYDSRGYWWPLTRLTLKREKQAMMLEGQVVSSFERWAALSLQTIN